MLRDTINKKSSKIKTFMEYALISLAKAGVILLVAFIIFSALGFKLRFELKDISTDSVKIDSYYPYQIKDKMLPIEIERGTDMDAVRELVNCMEECSPAFISNCNRVVISDRYVPEVTNTELEEGELPELFSGMAINSEAVVFYDKSFSTEVFYHEMAHIYEETNGNLSDSEEFQNIYNNSFKWIKLMSSAYCPDSQEGWAIGYAMYKVGTEGMKDCAPEAYAYFEKIDNSI